MAFWENPHVNVIIKWGSKSENLGLKKVKGRFNPGLFNPKPQPRTFHAWTFQQLIIEHGSYKWIIMREKCGRPDSNKFQLKWRFGTHGNWKNQNPGGRFGANS